MITRRRIFWICVPFVVIAGVIAAWFVFAQRDADFVVVGPKTDGMRNNFAILDTMIDPAEYRDCPTVRDAIVRLNEKLKPNTPPSGVNERFFWGWRSRHAWLHTDHSTIDKDLLASPFEIPAETAPLSVKEFLRLTFAQSGVVDVNFILRSHYVEATTAHRAQEERARYLDSVSVYDRMQNLWKELTGNVEQDPMSSYYTL